MLNAAWTRGTLGLMAAATVACSPGRPAQTAIADAETALAAAPADAQVYVAAAYQTATEQIAAAKAALENRNYDSALATAQQASTTIGGFAAAIETAKNEATANWNMMTTSMPGMVTAVENRLSELSRMRRLPAGVTRASLDGAKAALAEVKTMWGEATAASEGGNLMDAVTKGTACRTKLQEVMTALGMKTS